MPIQEWNDLVGTGEFKALPFEERDKQRVNFFERKISPTLKYNERHKARAQWDRATLRKPEPVDQPEGFTGALVAGTKSALTSAGATIDTVQGDTKGIEESARKHQRIGQTREQAAFHERIRLAQETDGDDTAWQGIKNVLSSAWEQPLGAAHETVAQLPNSAPAVATGFAFAKAGAAIGSAAGPAGAAMGGLTGMAMGYFLGNGLVETGHIAMSKADDGTVTSEEAGEALRQGAVKSGVITAFDVATIGLNKFLAGAPGRVVENAITKHLADKGIDAATAMADKELVRELSEVGADAFRQSVTMKKRVARNAAELALESGAEGAGENLGSRAAGLEASFTEAALESLMSIPQSAAEIAIAKDMVETGTMTQATSIALATHLDPVAIANLNDVNESPKERMAKARDISKVLKQNSPALAQAFIDHTNRRIMSGRAVIGTNETLYNILKPLERHSVDMEARQAAEEMMGEGTGAFDADQSEPIPTGTQMDEDGFATDEHLPDAEQSEELSHPVITQKLRDGTEALKAARGEGGEISPEQREELSELVKIKKLLDVGQQEEAMAAWEAYKARDAQGQAPHQEQIPLEAYQDNQLPDDTDRYATMEDGAVVDTATGEVVPGGEQAPTMEEVEVAVNDAATSPENALPEPTEAYREGATAQRAGKDQTLPKHLKFGAAHDITDWLRGWNEADQAAKDEGTTESAGTGDSTQDTLTEDPEAQQANLEKAAEIDTKANEAATSPQNNLPEPTDAEKEAGNYRKGDPFTLNGHKIVIENPKDSERKGTDPGGNKWSNTMGAHYGDLKGTTAADGDNLDVFVGPNPESLQIFIIDQQKENGSRGGFDEHKIGMGFGTREEFEKAYLDSYDKGWEIGPVSELTIEQFNDWVDNGDTTKPYGGELQAQEPGIDADAEKLDQETEAENLDDTAEEKPLETDASVQALGESGIPESKPDQENGEKREEAPDQQLEQEEVKQEPVAERKIAWGDRHNASLSEYVEDWNLIARKSGADWNILSDGKQIDFVSTKSPKLALLGHKAGTERNALRLHHATLLWNAEYQGKTINPRGRDDYPEALFENARQERPEPAPAEELKPPSKAEQLKAQIRAKEAEKKAATPSKAEELKAQIKEKETEKKAKAADAAVGQDSLLDTDAGAAHGPKIEDFGEKIGGAAKDNYNRLNNALSAEIDVATLPLSKVFPVPDYAKLAEEGVDRKALVLIAQIRGELGTKPRQRWKLARWAEKVDSARSFAAKLLSGDISVDQFAEKTAGTDSYAANTPAILDLADEVPAEYLDLLGDYKITHTLYSLYKGEKDVWKWELVNTKKDGGFGGMANREHFDSRDEAVATIRKDVIFRGENRDNAPKGRRAKTKLDLYSKRGQDGVWIGKKVASRKYIDLKRLDSTRKARAYLAEHNDELIEELEKKKQIPTMRREVNNTRIGPDYRNGVDVTPEQFTESFGFRGVEFGNWVEGGKRQDDLNQSFDGLMDMANMLGIPSQAISLNGELGLAFGARGKGGKNPAAAHYESGRVVINLTKKGGAGSLSHEWFHALDNYFDRMRKGAGFASEDPRQRIINRAGDRDARVRQEVLDGLAGIVAAIQESGIPARVTHLDNTRTKDYWGTTRELTARAFERYLIDRFAADENASDYLANIVDEDFWNASYAMDAFIEGSDQDTKTYPYPTDAEAPAINAAYQEFFDTLKTKETDQGTAIYEIQPVSYTGDYERETGSVQSRQRTQNQQKQGDDAGRGQVDLFLDPEAGAEAVEQQLADIYAVTVRNREIGRLKTATTTVSDPESLAHIVSGIRKNAQETFLAVVTDKDGGILRVMRHTIGLKDSSSVDPMTVVSEAASIDGAATLHYAHNHPSGKMAPSSADINITKVLNDVIDGTGIAAGLHVIVGNGGEFVSLDDENSVRKMKPRLRTQSVPMSERVLGKRGTISGEINNPTSASAAMSAINSDDAVVLLNTQHAPVGIVFLTQEEMRSLRSGGSARRVLSAVNATNAKAAIIKTNDKRAAENVARFLNRGGGGIRVLDWFSKDSSGFRSDASSGGGVAESKGSFFSRGGRRGAMSMDEAIRRATDIVGRLKLAKNGVNLKVIPFESELPQDIQQAAKDQGAEGEVDGVYHNGSLYIVADAVRDPAHLEEIVAHEGLGHFGARKLFGPDINKAYNLLFFQLGGAKGMTDKLDKRDKTVAKTFGKYVRDAANLSSKEQAFRLTDEFLAHMQQIQAIESLPAKTKRLAQELYGKLREWLASKGMTNLAKYTDADLAHLLKRMRQSAANQGEAANTRPVFMVRQPETTPYRRLKNIEKGELLWKGAAPPLADSGNQSRFGSNTENSSGQRTRHGSTNGQSNGSIAQDDPALSRTADDTAEEDIYAGYEPPSNLKKAVSGIKGFIRKHGLGALTRRHLAELGERYAPGFKSYVDLAQRMDADRNDLLADADGLGEEWSGWAKKNPKMFRQLVRLMHDTTIKGVDPSKSYEPLTNKKETINNIKVIQQQIRGRSGDENARLFAKIQDAKNLLAHENNRARAKDSLYQRWNDLSPEAQGYYSRVRDSYVEQRNNVKEALIQRIEASIADEKSKRALIDQVRIQFESNAVDPYFPLQRFGRYWLRVKNKADDTVEFRMFENEAEWQATVDHLRMKNADVAAGKNLEGAFEINGVSPAFITDVDSILSQVSGPAIDQIRDQVYQLYLQTLPDLSMRKHYIHRSNVEGYEQDALRAYADNMFHGGYQLARLRWSYRMENQLAALEEDLATASDPEAIKELAREVVDGEVPESRLKQVMTMQKNLPVVSDLLNEMRGRHEWAMNPKGSYFANAATSFGFAWFLGVSPAAAAVNLSQVPLVSLPVLGAKYGFGKASKELGRAMADYMKGGASKKGFFSIEKTLAGDELDAYHQWVRDGVIDKSLAHDLAGLSEQGFSRNDKMHKVMTVVSWSFHKAEVANREITALAAYRLAREDGKSHQQGVKLAEWAVWYSQFDYSTGNKARFMQNDFAKVFLLFRQFALNMTWIVARSAWNSLPLEHLSAEEKSEARKRLAGIMGMTWAFAGFSGLPVIPGVVEAIIEGLGDDDDDPIDAELEMRRWANDVFGGPKGGEVFSKGLFNAFLGIDAASRVGLDQLWMRDSSRDLEGRDKHYNYLAQAAGPVVGGMTADVFSAAQLFSEGRGYRALERMSPVAVRNLLKSARFATEGVQNMRGDNVLDDISTVQVLSQMAGFTPSELGDVYDQNSAIKRVEQRIIKRRRALVDDAIRAIRDQDADARDKALAAIGRYNRENPEKAITADSLRASMKGRARVSAANVSGIYIDPKLRPRLLEQRWR